MRHNFWMDSQVRATDHLHVDLTSLIVILMILFLLGIRIFSNICQPFIPKNCRSNPQPSRILLLTILTWLSWEIRVTMCPQSCMTNEMIFLSTLSTFHSFQAIFLLALLMVYILHSWSGMLGIGCSQYSDFSARHKTLVERLLSQGYKSNRMSNTFKKFYDRYNELIGKYNVCLPNLLKHCCLLNKD